MNAKAVNLAVVLLLVALVTGCGGGGGGGGLDDAIDIQGARNIILFIGDGMGAEHRKAARWMSAGESGLLAMDEMPSSGELLTAAADSAVTDSAAAATAMAAGVKTNNGVVGLDANLQLVSTILEKAQTQGKSIGLVTNTQVTHATPAAFASHIHSRALELEIARQILAARPDIILGGGEDKFLPLGEAGCYPEPGERDDGRNLIDEAVAAGYVYVCDAAAFDRIDPATTSKLIGLFADEGMVRPFAPSLAEMTRKTIGILSKNENGFFLMVEAGQIDWASHGNEAANAISDTIELDEAVDIALGFAAGAGSTLVIVTADHETGGMSVTHQPTGQVGEDGPFTMPDGEPFYVNWTTTDHTPANVPVMSQGPLAHRLTGVRDNTEVFNVMNAAFDAGQR